MTEPFRLGVIGTGAISRYHANAAAPHADQVRITAVADSNLAAAESFAAEIGGASVFDSTEALIASGEIDGAIVATPHFLHFAQALQLVEAGVPALVEKPLVTNLEDLRALRDAAARTGTLLVAGQMQRFDPVNVLARQWAEADEERFGQLASFSMRSWQDITAYTANVGLGHWLLNGELAGGGVVVSLAVHQLDLMRYLSGTDYATVTAVGQFAEPFHTGAESSAAVLITMSNGAMGTLHSTYNAPRGFQSESLSIFGENGGFTRDFRTQGLYHGPLLYSGAHTEDLIDFSSPETVSELGLLTDLHVNPFENQLLHFARAARGEVAPLNSVTDNFNTIACIAAINQALLEPGKTITVPTT